MDNLNQIQTILFTFIIPAIVFLAGYTLGMLQRTQQLFHYAYVDVEMTEIDRVLEQFKKDYHEDIRIRSIPELDFTDKDGKDYHFPGCIRLSKPFFSLIETDGSTLNYLIETVKGKGFKIIDSGKY